MTNVRYTFFCIHFYISKFFISLSFLVKLRSNPNSERNIINIDKHTLIGALFHTRDGSHHELAGDFPDVNTPFARSLAYIMIVRCLRAVSTDENENKNNNLPKISWYIIDFITQMEKLQHIGLESQSIVYILYRTYECIYIFGIRRLLFLLLYIFSILCNYISTLSLTLCLCRLCHYSFILFAQLIRLFGFVENILDCGMFVPWCVINNCRWLEMKWKSFFQLSFTLVRNVSVYI